jgi:hypothetical protein
MTLAVDGQLNNKQTNPQVGVDVKANLVAKGVWNESKMAYSQSSTPICVMLV